MTRARAAASLSAWTPEALCGIRPLSSSRRWATTRAAGPPQWRRKSRRRRRPAPSWAQAVQQARQPAAAPLRSADDVASTSECGSAKGELQLLWSTPLWTSNALECGAVDESFNDRLTSLAVEGMDEFARQQTQLDERLRDDISWLSHAFFEWQLLQYHSNGGWPALYQSPDYHALESLVRSSVASMMAAVGMTDAGQDTSLMVWCAMHHDGTEHREHAHPDVLMSGTCGFVAFSVCPLANDLSQKSITQITRTARKDRHRWSYADRQGGQGRSRHPRCTSFLKTATAFSSQGGYHTASRQRAAAWAQAPRWPQRASPFLSIFSGVDGRRAERHRSECECQQALTVDR